MALSFYVVISWFGYILVCFYLIRPIPKKLIRSVLTFFICILLTYTTCQNLPRYNASSMMIIAVCWMISIRLIDLTIFSINKCLTFQSFLFKTLWMLFPLLPLKSKRDESSIKFYLMLIVIKLLINHWNYGLSMICETRVVYERVLLFYVSTITISYVLDVQKVLVRIITRDKYTLESFTNFPIFSLSLREFWGQRYNRLIGTVLKESIFKPIRLEFSSSTIGGLTTFTVSGLLHVHNALIIFNDISLLFPTFMFFILHGIVCSLEAYMKIQLPKPVGWLLTHTFIFLTSPLVLQPFMKKGSPFLMLNSPPLYNVEWIPKLPVSNFCP